MLQFYMITQDKEAYLIERLSSGRIGDDAAVIGKTLYSVDAFYEDIHFRRAWMSPYQIAKKAMLVNFSDAIAMNAHPQYALLSLCIPKDMDKEEIDALMRGFEETAATFDCEIIGGDTVGGDKLHVSITIISHSEAPLYRKGLKEGDLLAFTGTLGESKRDLERLFAGKEIADDSRFLEPKLRSEFIYRSRHLLCVGMDISDGLYCDTNKLLDINKYGYKILENINDKMGFSGEEYEMIIGFAGADYVEIKSIANALHTPLTVFAEVAKNSERFPCQSHHFDRETV